ncbi:MAG: DUF721 domain-containing protein [Hyphomicrobiales bacterium]|nr:DUF721 domain-containing protein [Hyphomicrobiales bacterium]MDE2114930.1 DUF721 domain-containing protein [Hyphomicrobiales bacterium]
MPRPPRAFTPSAKPFAGKHWARPLAELIGSAMDPAIAKRGFTETSLLLNFDEIVGPRIARHCEPIQLQFRPRAKDAGGRDLQEPATLILRVEGAFALEIQHLSPTIIERVNAHFGWACIGRLRLKQGPLNRNKPPVTKPPPDAHMQAKAGEYTGGIEDDELRLSLTRLGARVIQAAAMAATPQKKPSGR